MDDFRFTIGVLSTRRACGGTLISCVNGWSVSRHYQMVARLKVIQFISILGGMNIITIRKQDLPLPQELPGKPQSLRATIGRLPLWENKKHHKEAGASSSLGASQGAPKFTCHNW